MANYVPYQQREYQQSDAVTKAQEMLQQQLANKPGQYTSQWQSQLNDVMDKILNREKFSYDLNGDALYKQYKDQYTNQGKMAMMDTMGQAAAMTGGYGNSYAQNVGQQAYQGYLQQLNDKIPELYNLALSKYQMEGDDLSRQYSMLGDRESTDYGRYRDTVSDYNSELSRLQNAYDNERSFDYGQYRDQVSDDRYNQQLAQAQVDHLISIGANVSDSLLAAAGYDRSYLSSINALRAAQAAAAAKAAASGGGGGKSSGISASSGGTFDGTVNGKKYFDQDDARALLETVIESTGSPQMAVNALVNEGASLEDAKRMLNSYTRNMNK